MPPARKSSSPLSSATPSPNLPAIKPDPGLDVKLDLDLGLNSEKALRSCVVGAGGQQEGDGRSRLSSLLSMEGEEMVGRGASKPQEKNGEGEEDGEGDENVDEDEDDDEEDEDEDERDRRSLTSDTSDTVPRSMSDESELTEEPPEEADGEEADEDLELDGADGGGVGIVVKVPPTIEDDAEDAGDVDQEEQEEADQVLPPSKRVKRMDTTSRSGSPSLTPPPPSEKANLRALPDISPRATRKRGRSDDDGRPDADPVKEDNTVDGEDGDGVDVEDEDDGDGDVTMRLGEVEVRINGNGPEEGVDAPMPAEEGGEDVEEEPEHPEIAEEEVDVDAAEATSHLTLPLRPSGHSHSSHAPPPTPAAIRSLLMLELKFAALRDKLYIERMEEAAAEEEMIHDGTHPALTFLYKTLAGRRERLHEVASRRHQQALEEIGKARQAEKDAVWTWWTEERDRLHWEEFEQTWSKRRRLAREKNEIETPRPVKAIPRPTAEKPLGKRFDWSAGVRAAKLSVEDAIHDLALMENRRSIHASRHASPAVFTQQPLSQGQVYAATGLGVVGPSSQPTFPTYTTGQTYSQATSSSAEAEPHRQHHQIHSHAQPQAHAPPRSHLGGQQQSMTHQVTPTRPPASGNAQSQSMMAPHGSVQAFNHIASGGQVDSGGVNRSASSSMAGQQHGSGGFPVRREGRTVPTTSTMFGGISVQSQAQAQAQTSSTAHPQAPSKEIKSEVLQGNGPNGAGSRLWGGTSTLGLGMGLGLGVGLDKLTNGHSKDGHDVSDIGEGLSSAAAQTPNGTQPSAPPASSAAATSGPDIPTVSSSATTKTTPPFSAPTSVPTSTSGEKQSTPPSTVSRVPAPASASAATSGATTAAAPAAGGTAPDRRFGLADYLGGAPGGTFGAFGGLGKVGVLSPPKVGLGARSPFTAGNSPGQQQTATVPRS